MSWLKRLLPRPHPAPPPVPFQRSSQRFNKIEGFAELMLTGKVNLFTASYKVMLTNHVPRPTDRVYSDVAPDELPTGHGYRRGGTKLANRTFVKVGDAWRLMGTIPPWIAKDDWNQPFRCAVLYVSTGPVKALIGYWYYGTEIKLKKGSTFNFTIDQANGLFAFWSH